MSEYYLKGDSVTQDGLTPDTGFHNVANLIAALGNYQDGDVINFVEGALIDDSAHDIFLGNGSIILQSYSGNIGKPIWKLYPWTRPEGGGGGDGFSWNGSALYYIKILNLNISGTTKLNLTTPNPLDVYSEITGCVFDKCWISGLKIKNFRIKNNIFKNLGSLGDLGGYNSDQISLSERSGPGHIIGNAEIINNTFYNWQFPGGIKSAINLIGQIWDGLKVKNNIFLTCGSAVGYGISATLDGTGTNIVDYNDVFDITPGNEFSGVPVSVLGSNNIYVDPLLTEPSNEDFTLQEFSPCINAGDNTDAPTVDIIGVSRPQDINVDIGAYEYANHVATIYYLNAGSTTQDGLTPTTGYHNLESLITNITLRDNDIIEIVDNGVVSERPNEFINLYVPASIIIRPYDEGHKPSWSFSGSINFSDFTEIYDINFLSSIGNYGILEILSNTTIQRCKLTNVIIDGIDVSSINISNNIVVGSIVEGYFALLFEMRTEASENIFINNNTFYGFINGAINIYDSSSTDPGLGLSGVKILNNTFSNILDAYVAIAIYAPGASTSSCSIDYNNFYLLSGTNFDVDVLPEWIGTHNILLADPLLVDPEHGDFTLQINSPCIDSGIDHSEEVSIPTIDFITTFRPQELHTDIGAYEYNSINLSGIPSEESFGTLTIDSGHVGLIDSSHQVLFNGYILSDSTVLSTDSTFIQGQILTRGDLTLTLADWTYAWGRQLDATTYVDGTWGYRWCTPIWINYSIWYQDYDTSQFSLVGYRYRDPVNDSIGKFYAPMVVPSPPGHYEARWRFQKDSSSYAKEIREPFVSLSRGVDAMRDYPPRPPSTTDSTHPVGDVWGVDPGVDVIGLF